MSEKNENVWWYDGERIAFRTPNYMKILNAMRTQPTLTLADMKEETGISVTAIRKLLDQLITNYMEAQAQWQKAWSDWIDAKAELRLSETRYLKATGRL